MYSSCALLFVLRGFILERNKFPSLSLYLFSSLSLSLPLSTRYRAQTQRLNAIQDANPILQPPASYYLWVLVQRAWKHNGRIVVG